MVFVSLIRGQIDHVIGKQLAYYYYCVPHIVLVPLD